MPAIGSSKKRKRKAKGTTKLLGGLSLDSMLIPLVYLVLVGVIAGGAVYYYEAIKPADYMGQALAEIKSTGRTVLIADKELRPNAQLGGTYNVIGVPSYAMPSDAISEMEASKLLASTTVPKGTILTRTNTYNPATMSIDESAVDYSIRSIINFDWLNDGDYIDVRLARFRIDNNKAVDDMVVVAKKRVTISENRKFISIPLTESEIKIIKTAEVEGRVISALGKSTPYNVDIYATVYTEPGNQKPSPVTYSAAGVVVSNPSNSVKSLEDLLKPGTLTDDITYEIVDDETKSKPKETPPTEEIDTEENFEDVIEEGETISPEGRG